MNRILGSLLVSTCLLFNVSSHAQYVSEIVKSCPDASATTPVCPVGNYTFTAADKNSTWMCRDDASSGSPSNCNFTFPVMPNGWFVTVGAAGTSVATFSSTASFDNGLTQLTSGAKVSVQADDTGNFLVFAGATGAPGPIGPPGPKGDPGPPGATTTITAADSSISLAGSVPPNYVIAATPGAMTLTGGNQISVGTAPNYLISFTGTIPPPVTIQQGPGISVVGGPPNPYVISTSGSTPPPPPPPPPLSGGQGVDFRATASFVTDPTNYTNDVSVVADYPTMSPQGNKIGWEAGVNNCILGSRDRNSAIDARMAGISFANPGATCVFRIDLPSTGSYGIQGAFGDNSYPQGPFTVQFEDNTSIFATPVNNISTSAPGQSYAANGKLETSAANWTANNPSPGAGADEITHTFTSTIFRVVITGSGFAPIQSLYVRSIP